MNQTNVNEYTREDEIRIDGIKLFYDALKHLTTLSAGSALLLVTFLEKLFTKPHWRILVALALGCFFIALLSSVIAMFYIAEGMTGIAEEDRQQVSESVGNKSMYVALACFLLGILIMIVFAIRNLW